MASLLPRKELATLKAWAVRPGRKPLVIRGARQVGKSTLVRQFAAESGMDLLVVNFERNPELRQPFTSRNPAEILASLQLLVGAKISPGKTLLFLDEIQAAPEALAALRYFHEERPDLHLLAAGSLLEFTLAEAEFSMPVGRIEYMHLGVMSFSDFLRSRGQEMLADYLQKISVSDIRKSALLPAVHDKCMVMLRQYWITGGLPEAVALFAHTGDFSEVARIQQNIVATYRDDFHKYAARSSSKALVQMIFDQLPVMVGRKFSYAQVSHDHRAAELAAALQQLCLARIAYKVFHSSANGIPLAAEANIRHFKTIYLDIGLMCAALKVNLNDLHRSDVTLINEGALAEQFIGQHLLYGGNDYEAPELFYWVREARTAAAEIDYLMTCGQQIVPVEIKAGTTGTLKSLHQFLKEKNRHFALRFNADLPSLLGDAKKHTDGSVVDYELLSLPLYMVEQAPRLVKEILCPG